MSIRGIDTQIMISRLLDNVRDTSSIQKRPEVAQDTLAAHAKVNDAHEQAKVAKTMESDMEGIRADVEGGSGSGYGDEGGSGHGKDDEKDEFGPGTFVPSERHVIDITI